MAAGSGFVWEDPFLLDDQLTGDEKLIRDTARSFAQQRLQPHVIEAILNHVSGFRAGVGGTYNRNPYEREKAQALELWDRHIMSIVEM